MAVRSAVLAAASTTVVNNGVLVATVPAGETWLIKGVLLYNVSANSASVLAYVRRPSVSVFGFIVRAAVTAVNSASWSGLVVAEAGDQLYMQSDQQPTHVWFSGSKLSG